MKTKPEHKIKLEEGMVSLLRNRGMNGSALAQRPYDFRPVSFTSDIEGLKPKTFSSQKQLAMFESFLADPFAPRNYCIVSAPNDSMAKLLAAYMMQYAVKQAKTRATLPLWVDILGGFENKLVQNHIGSSLLVLNNVGATSTQPKIEKLRDIIETFPDIPKIVVATGADPYAFFTKYLYLPLHGLAYLTNNTVKRVVEL
jgi:hypothetical protein